MNLLAELAAMRTGQGLSQATLAARLGVPRLAITRLESGIGSAKLLQRAMEEIGLRVSGVARGDSLPEQLRARRTRLGMDEQRIAKKADLDVRTLRAVERGESTVGSLLAVLAAVAPNAKRSDPPRASWAYDPRGLAERDKRFTPRWLLDHIVAAFGEIDLDPCAHELSAVEAKRRIMLPQDGLAASWAGHGFTYVNPPYSAASAWMTRITNAWDQQEVSKIAMLVPCRTDSEVFQRRISRFAETLFLGGRFRFESPAGLAWAAPFALMLNVWRASEDEIERFQTLMPSVRMRASEWTALTP